MDTWFVVLIILLILAIGGMAGGVYFIETKNNQDNIANIIYPFTGKYDANSEKIILEDSTGNPQITCKGKGKNTKINIVGAFFDVEDPYGQCTGTSNSVLDLTCGIPGNKIKCSNTTDCGNGMECSDGFCQPATAILKKDGTIDADNSGCLVSGGDYCPIQPGVSCSMTDENACNDKNQDFMTCVPDKNGNNTGTCQVKSGSTCFGVNTDNNTCALFPICNNRTNNKSTVVNKKCDPSQRNCISRDASAYLAGVCDGKETCIEKGIVASNSNNPAGPLPCSTKNISGLPVTPGNKGNYNQGYYFHGIYTCVPE